MLRGKIKRDKKGKPKRDKKGNIKRETGVLKRMRSLGGTLSKMGM